MAALLCHPHPLFGGTMHNKVVYQAAKSLDALGLTSAALQFSRHGHRAEGQHDKGRGEQEDVRTALEFLSAEYPQAPILLAGFQLWLLGRPADSVVATNASLS
jgi:alpha/beta superfamily hydrolase